MDASTVPLAPSRLVPTPFALALLVLSMLVLVPGDGARAADRGGLTRLDLGVKAGPALSQHQGTEGRDLEYDVSSTLRRGGAAGVFVVLPVTRRFHLQQEVLLVQKGSRQEIGVDILDVPAVLDVEYDMVYVEIPLLLRYHWYDGRSLDVYTLGGFGFGLKIDDRYQLDGEVSDGTETIAVTADSDMSEVDLFDFFFTYGTGLEFPVGGSRMLVEYRFDLSLQQLPLPTYAYVPFGEDDEILVENDPVPLRNQSHMLLVGFRF